MNIIYKFVEKSNNQITIYDVENYLFSWFNFILYNLTNSILQTT